MGVFCDELSFWAWALVRELPNLGENMKQKAERCLCYKTAPSVQLPDPSMLLAQASWDFDKN